MKRNLLLILLGLAGYGVFLIAGLPARDEVRALGKRNPKTTAVMQQRQAEAEAKGRKARRVQTFLPLDQVSRHLIHAVVTMEDPRFFGHEGIDWGAVRESIEADVKAGSFVRGGSTITQQLAKNLFFSTRKSVNRKLREVVVTRWLEGELSKKRILELYVNVIEWGDGIYGCEAAARAYYGRSCRDLDETEAAGLVAMIPSPRRINPKVNAARHARAQKRVLWRMAKAGYVKRDVGSLGAEPPPEESEDVEEDEAPAAAEPPLPEPAPEPEATEEPASIPLE